MLFHTQGEVIPQLLVQTTHSIFFVVSFLIVLFFLFYVASSDNQFCFYLCLAHIHTQCLTFVYVARDVLLNVRNF